MTDDTFSSTQNCLAHRERCDPTSVNSKKFQASIITTIIVAFAMDGARTARVVAVRHQSACDACPGNSGPLLRTGFEKFADLLEPCAVSFACPVFREALPLELVFVGA